MKFRYIPSVSAFAFVVAMAPFAPAFAEGPINPETVEAVSEGQSDRYSLVAVDDEILRVDRQNGTVSVCRPKNEAWRCNPVPLAEEAYLAEINDLATEVDRLTARLQELEGNERGQAVPVPPGSGMDRPDKKNGAEKPPSSLSKEDEEELDKALDFTERAMRRFFGMVRDLQKDLDSSSN